MTLIDGKAVSAQIKKEIAEEVAQIVAVEASVLTSPPSWWVTTEAARRMWQTK